ncbi:hypothetical protein RRG08_050968, partial [Elysia crispata]
MPRNEKSGMYSIKKNCFGHSSVGQRPSHEVVEPLEIGDQPEKKCLPCCISSSWLAIFLSNW